VDAPPVEQALLDGRYRVGPVLARGGMSVVHRGHDTRLDRPVAVKIMDERLAGDPAFRVRFEREARSAARIDHPAVVDVFDQGSDAGRLFLVMELVEGGTLREVLRARGPLGVPRAVAIMERVLAGLAEAHRLGLVHRDVKPENVLVSATGEVKVADFGLAVAAAQAGASHAGTILGTVAYLSPEQVATGAADPRSDVYAAGVLLYELLTGAPPYSGDTAISVAYRHVNSDVPPPSRIATEVPPELDALVIAATRRDPAARPADAAGMLAELHRVAAQLEVPRVAVPPPPPRPVEEQATVPSARPVRGSTRALERPAPTSPTAATAPPQHRAARRRGRRAVALWIAVVLVLAIVVGVSAWWLGSGRWTAMPTLRGVQQQTAEQLVAQADLVPTATQTYDDGVASGLVTSTEPAPDTRLLRGTTVRIVVSKGRPTVPAIGAGTAVADAEAAVRAAQLTPVRRSDATTYSDTVPQGALVRTDPAAGSALPLGGTVTLVLSAGKEPPKQVRVPRLVGRDFSEAADLLDGLGLKAEQRTRFGGFGRRDGLVIGQSNGAGSLVDPGTTIVLDTF
jgi:eukaryotic-like serine/threonine-protein kinase